MLQFTMYTKGLCFADTFGELRFYLVLCKEILPSSESWWLEGFVVAKMPRGSRIETVSKQPKLVLS